MEREIIADMLANFFIAFLFINKEKSPTYIKGKGDVDLGHTLTDLVDDINEDVMNLVE